jgi:hypothetical protein
MLFANAIARLLPLMSYIGRGLIVADDMLGIKIIITGVVFLIASIIHLRTKKEKGIALPTIFLITSVFGFEVYESLTRSGFPLMYPLLSAISFLVLLMIFGWKNVNSASAAISKVAASVSEKRLSKIQKKLFTVAIVSIFLLSIFPNIRIARASTIVDHRNLTSADGKFRITVYIYKHEDTIDSKEFYGFNVLVHADNIAFFDWIERLDLYAPGFTFDDWQPKDGGTTGGSITLTPSGPGISIAIPYSDVAVGGEYTDRISWWVNPIFSNPQDIEVAAKAWCLAGTPLYWKLYIKAWSGVVFMFTWTFFWLDTLEFSTFPVTVWVCGSKGGTTNDPPGLYSFTEPTTITVKAIPTEQGLFGPVEFWRWQLTGSSGTQYYFKNPLTITLGVGEWRLTAQFKQSFVWVGDEYYHWVSGAVVCNVIVFYCDMDWNVIYERSFKAIKYYL